MLAAVRRLRADASAGDAFGELDGRVRPRLLRYFRARGFSPVDAEDLVQKTLARVYQNVGALRQESSFLPWLFTIARNVGCTARHRQREEARRTATLDEGAEATARGWSGAEAERLTAAVESIERLPPQQRHCVILRVRDEMSYQEIADLLRLSVNTVRNHLAQARRTLKETLGAQWADR